MPLPDNLTFTEGGPFFDMVSAFIVAIMALEPLWDPSNPMGYKPGVIITLEGKVQPELRFDRYQIHRQAVDGKLPQIHIGHSMTVMLVNTAYESVKDDNDHSPEFEFFRHIRNSSSHRNRFNFSGREPARPASWRGKSINHTLKGDMNPLQGMECFGSFLASADALLLLWDIEQRLLTNP